MLATMAWGLRPEAACNTASPLQPFIDRGQPVLRLFPDSYWAFALPVFAGMLLWSVTLTALGCVLVRSQVTK